MRKILMAMEIGQQISFVNGITYVKTKRGFRNPNEKIIDYIPMVWIIANNSDKEYQID